MSDDIIPLYAGEVQFAGYTDSSRSGPRVTLRLADRDDLQRFVGLEGRRFMLALVEIGDGEEPKKPTAAPAPAAAPAEPPAPALPKGGRLANEAGIMCSQRAFQRQVELDFPELWERAGGETLEERAANCIRVMCGISSRAELDHNADAAEAFQRCFRKKWLLNEAGITL